jgi:hypothetical protein
MTRKISREETFIDGSSLPCFACAQTVLIFIKQHQPLKLFLLAVKKWYDLSGQ